MYLINFYFSLILQVPPVQFHHITDFIMNAFKYYGILGVWQLQSKIGVIYFYKNYNIQYTSMEHIV